MRTTPREKAANNETLDFRTQNRGCLTNAQLRFAEIIGLLLAARWHEEHVGKETPGGRHLRNLDRKGVQPRSERLH
jgi:hypothetical protein